MRSWHDSSSRLSQRDVRHAMFSTDGPIRLRRMTEQDLPMLHDWLSRPHIVEWCGGERPTLAQVRRDYMPGVLARQQVTPYIATLDGEPFAYAQSYVAKGAGDGWWEDETDPGVRGIDQSIAYPELLGIGLGTKLVRALVDLLFGDPAVTKIQTDPSPNNHRAIRCYEKAGFRRVKTIVTPDGPAVYMLQCKPSAASGRTSSSAEHRPAVIARWKRWSTASRRALSTFARTGAVDPTGRSPAEVADEVSAAIPEQPRSVVWAHNLARYAATP
jgi:AacA4 family aminoglycoside N(6')-acetyltransferase